MLSCEWMRDIGRFLQCVRPFYGAQCPEISTNSSEVLLEFSVVVISFAKGTHAHVVNHVFANIVDRSLYLGLITDFQHSQQYAMNPKAWCGELAL